MSNQDTNPHFILVPLMTQGHMIPMVDMACLLADRGAIVSFITTPVNAARIRPAIDSVAQSNLPIQFVELPFPCAEAGLPKGCENIDLIPPGYSYKQFYIATTLLHVPLEHYLRNHPHRGPTCMIHDHCHPWTMKVARNLGIPRLVFTGASASYALYNYNLDTPPFFSAPGWEDARDAAVEAEATAVGTLINTFDELESKFVKTYREATGKKVWAIGPLSLYNKDDASMSTRGNKSSVDEGLVSSWLGTMEPESVIYVSFGTLSRTGPSQLREIGLGLEAAKQPFVWVIKEKSPEVDRWLEGFKERTKGRGLIVKGWAPQVMILSHPAVGGFLTHCGWNSTLEAVSTGVPMVTWPRSTDQFLNEELIVDVLQIGVAISENGGGVVRWGDVKKAVVKLMNKGEEGEKRRERSRELGVQARKAMEEGGSSYKNLTDLIKYFSEHANKDFI